MSRLTLGLVVALAAGAVVAAAGLAGAARPAGEASGLIAFTRGDGLYVMRSDGSGVRRIMKAGQEALETGGAAWSPDGKRLVYADWSGIWLMDADGRHRVRVATGRETVYIGVKPHRQLFSPSATYFGSPTWSPDGRRIAFTAFHGVANRDVFVMNADGSNQHLVKETPYFEGEVDWSSGGRLVFDSGGWVSDLYLMRTDGSGLRHLTPRGGWAGSGQPSWSADGRRIVYAKQSGLWVMDAGDRAPVQLTRHRLDGSPDWSPDGRKIAFVRTLVFEKGTSPMARAASREIFVMNADGTGVTRLTHNNVGEGSPAWQPVAAS